MRKLATIGLFTVGIISAMLLVGCGEKAAGPVQMTAEEQEAWEIALVEMRIDKNEAFRDPEQSPLMVQDMQDFEGLNYYFPVRELKYRLKLNAAAVPDTVEMTKRKGDIVRMVNRGFIRFEHAGRSYELAVYGPASTEADDYLWLPFYDKTSGTETYGGGRYLDLELDAEGYVLVDFNYAYNPLCDYNTEKYNCTLPPAANSLDFAVEAGERLFRLEE